MTPRKFSRMFACLTIAMGASLPSARAGTYPDHPIRMIVPYSPGSGIDILARTVGQKMATILGQAIVVDDKAGASGMIGTREVKNAPADGYTVMMSVIGHVLNPIVFQGRAQYDAVKDFTPITMTAWGRLALVVHPKTGIHDFKGYLDAVNAAPDKITYGSPGIGTPHHLAMELLRRIAHFDVMHVPYSSTAGVTTGMLAGDVDSMFMPVHIALPYIQAGKLTALGLASAQRSAIAPDIPTMAELGYKGAEADMWYGLLGPAGMPPEIVKRLNDAAAQALADPEVVKTLQKQGMEVSHSTPEAFRTLMEQERVKWTKVITEAKIVSE